MYFDVLCAALKAFGNENVDLHEAMTEMQSKQEALWKNMIGVCFFSSKKQLSILITHFLTAVILLSVDTSRQWATVSSWILQECRLYFFEKGMLSARIDLQANGERRRVAPLLCVLKKEK